MSRLVNLTGVPEEELTCLLDAIDACDLVGHVDFYPGWNVY
jgi:hypothetical protein